MSLNINEPSDQRTVSELPGYIRAIHQALNALELTSNITVTDLYVSTGVTALVIGVELSTAVIEVILIDSLSSDLVQIRGGTEGQVKIFIFQGNNISFTDGVKSDGRLYLNQLPVGSIFNAQQDDVIALVNIGGDGSAEYGYWKEVWRQLSVK